MALAIALTTTLPDKLVLIRSLSLVGQALIRVTGQ